MTNRATAGLVCLLAGSLLALHARGDVTIFDNGPFVTEAGVGLNGADVSRAETGVITIGFNANATTAQGGPLRIADDFVVTTPAGVGGYRLSSMTFFGVQSTTSTNNVRFGAFYVALYDGNPSAGGNLIAGDFTTNRLISSTFSNAYRLSSTGLVTGNSRPITRLDVDMSWAPVLASGTYWMVVSAVGDTALTASPNPQTIFVTPHFATANAQQFFNSSWFAIWDPPFVLRAFCPADFDRAGGVTVADIFSFLNAWFAGDVSADFDGIDGVQVADIFGFLNRWFSGC